MMNKINERLTEFIQGTYNMKEIPQFHFQPLTIEGKKALREKCVELWEKGVVSTRTMMDTNGYSIEIESRKREEEASQGYDEMLAPRDATASAPTKSSNIDNSDNPEGTEKKKRGRPKKSDSDRKSDPSKSETGREPKPSRPEGSKKQEDTG